MAGKELDGPGLTSRQAEFARLIVLDRVVKGDPKAAAIAAGYSIDNAYDASRRLLSLPLVQQAVRTHQRKCLTDLATDSLHVARELMHDPATPASSKVALIKAVWATSGLVAPQALDKPGDRPLTASDKAELKAFVKENLARMEEKAIEAKGVQVVDIQGEG